MTPESMSVVRGRALLLFMSVLTGECNAMIYCCVDKISVSRFTRPRLREFLSSDVQMSASSRDLDSFHAWRTCHSTL